MYLRKYKIPKAAFIENTSQQLPLYMIWFRVSPNQKNYFMSGMYLKPSQTSKMKLLTKVVNASRDVFRTVLSIQNVFRTSRMALTFFGSLSNPKSMGSTHVLLGKGSGKIWTYSCWEKGNFIMINELKYGQTWKIWPSLLSLSLYNPFNGYF